MIYCFICKCAQVDIKWRVDVTMTTNMMLKVRKPSLMMELYFDDGAL